MNYKSILEKIKQEEQEFLEELKEKYLEKNK